MPNTLELFGQISKTVNAMKFETHVKEIVPRTYNVRSFRFPKPPTLSYKAGQFLIATIKTEDGKELSKPFSISSSPTETEHIEFTKKLSDSEYSTALKALKAGNWARIDAPYGSFTFEGEHEKICLLGGGIGITPFRSICRYCTDKRVDAKITLLYGNRSENDIVFREEFEAMQKQNPNLKVVFTVNEASSAWKGTIGFISTELVKKEIPDYKENVFYTCGPPAMVEAMEKLVEALGLPKTQLKREYFAGYM
jgi:ferredoxin-NADP reductase